MFTFKIIKNTIPNTLSQESLSHLKKHNTYTFWVTLAFSFLLAIVFSQNNIEIRYIAVWISVLLLTSLIRLRLNTTQHVTTIPTKENHKKWMQRYVLLTTFMSATWGITGFMFTLALPEAHLLLQTTYTLSLLAIIISTPPLLLISKPAFSIQFILILVPFSLNFLPQLTQSGYWLIGAALLGFSTIFFLITNQLHEVIIELNESRKALRSQADTDQLTQLANRRLFDAAFKSEWRRSTREQKTVSLLIIDVDDFKRYNDAYGHQKGDNALKHIALQIKAAAQRPGDISARIGGEEFAILLPDTTTDGAMVVAERLRHNIERIGNELTQNLHKNGSKSKHKLTVSIGVSSCTPLLPNE
ncbi:MAG TPA: GGDEF domain-containing protein, partial [Thiothrix sp.]|nr:GGDEF domain-containing protein [Thiothrix sp.]